MEAVLYFAVCLVATTLGAISGMGGGVIIKPVLDMIAPYSAAQVSFLSGLTVLAMACVSCFKAMRSGARLTGARSVTLAVSAAAGGVLGKQVFAWLTSAAAANPVKIVQNALLLALTAAVFVMMTRRDRLRTARVTNPLLTAAAGLLLGAVSAFLGIGGGPINIAILTLLFSMDAKECARQSIFIILFSQATSLLTTVVTGSVPQVSPLLAALMMAGGVLGAFVGAAVLRAASLKRANSLLLLTLALVMAICVVNIARAAL